MSYCLEDYGASVNPKANERRGECQHHRDGSDDGSRPGFGLDCSDSNGHLAIFVS